MSKRILSALLVCIMLLGVFAAISIGTAASQNPDVVMPMADPVIDGIIEDSGAWSKAAVFGENTVSNFWSGNALNSEAELYFAYSTKGLYFAADVVDNDLIYSTGYDNIDDDYGFNGDVMTLMLDTLGLFEQSSSQVTPWYNFGVFEDGTVKCFRSRANAGEITDSITLAGGLTDKGFRFEALISWNDVTADAKAAGGFDVNGLSLISKGSVSRAACMFMDRYQKNSTTVDTWGRYITICDNTYDGYPGANTSGYTAKSFGLVLKNGEKPEHIWAVTDVTKEATCEEEGSMTRTCSDCGKTEVVSIPVTEHSYGDWVDVSGSLRERECRFCGATEQETVDTEKKSDQLIVAYFNASVAIDAYEFHNIDVINFHPAHIEQNAPGSGNVFSHPYTSRLEQYRSIAREQNPDIKFLFTVANGNLSVFESWFFNTAMAERLADEVVKVVKTYDYDGFDVDYEFPTGTGNTKANFVHFMKTLKEKFAELSEETGKEYYLSMAVPGTQWTFSLFDMNALAEHVSYFNMMNYDLYIGENGKYTAHHHTPAYDNYNGLSGGSVYGDIQLYLERGIPADKIVAGCGLYALRWTGVQDGGTHGLYQSGTCDFTNLHYTQLKYSFVNKGGYVRYWDEKAGAPYLYNASQKVFISYDDEQSVELKCKITAEEGIRGIMVFDYCTTDGIGLFDSMRGWLDQYTPEEDVLDQFEDINKGAWYADAVRYCVTKGYASGMSDTVFAPNGKLTRAQFLTLLAKLDGVDLTKYDTVDSGFADVKTSHWFNEVVCWAVEEGITSGLSATQFGPNANVTRAQVARFFYVYSEKNGISVEGAADLSVYPDAAKVADWAKTPMEWAVNAGLISGVAKDGVNYLDPNGTATRAQAMQIIKQFDSLKNN